MMDVHPRQQSRVSMGLAAASPENRLRADLRAKLGASDPRVPPMPLIASYELPRAIWTGFNRNTQCRVRQRKLP